MLRRWIVGDRREGTMVVEGGLNARQPPLLRAFVARNGESWIVRPRNRWALRSQSAWKGNNENRYPLHDSCLASLRSVFDVACLTGLGALGGLACDFKLWCQDFENTSSYRATTFPLRSSTSSSTRTH
ncbi:hypothetical protein EJ06DRAFT_11873 [Trichodelitschia bisporula]|uniref:Uncharacterized protein n=1 Tax=Trichodelitschia bisporula TaxID=703511 RepID=A0A6G1I9W2_9PEZI|nr:hypothetical protein EJ06DRAFT_11873 [Trichodelitschia bisporula]